MPRSPKLGRKNGYWYTKAGDPNGVYFGKIGEVPYSTARKLFGEYLRSLQATRHGTNAVPSVAELCDQFLEWVKKNRSERTYDERQRHLNRFCQFRVGPQQVGELNATDVQADDLHQFLAYIREKHQLDDFTQDKHATSIKAAFNWATKHPSPVPLLPTSFRPFASIEKYKRPTTVLSDHDLLTAEEIEALLRFADADLAPVIENRKLRRRRPDEYRAEGENPYIGFQELLRCYWLTGARTSELASCRVRDFIRSSHQLVLGRHKRSRTMKEATTRRITLNDEAYAIVVRHCQGKQPDDFIFTDFKGRPWTRTTLDYRFAAVRERAGVREEITIYSFRHLWISESLMAGIDIATVARMAGTSVLMIEKVYGHFSTAHLREAQAKLDQLRSRQQAAKTPTSRPE
jgi:integrase